VKHRFRDLLAVAMSVLLLGYIGQRIGFERLTEQLSTLNPGWISLAIALSVIQHALSACRWQLASAAFGLHLSLRAAIAHYYASGLLNATLPSGMAGEAMRIWVQARSETQHANGVSAKRLRHAALAVASERAAGQIMLGLLAIIGALICAVIYPSSPRVITLAIGAASINLVFIIAIVVATRITFSRAANPPQIPWPTLVAVSLPVTLSYVAVFICALLAAGHEVTPSLVTIAIPLSLLAMSVPVSVGGFGPREAAALFLWGMLGSEPESGAIGALTYGIICLVATLPGLVPIGLLLGRQNANRSNSTHRADRG
jgi:uncharacterized membrane protein YbhN (UPF0104 family)